MTFRRFLPRLYLPEAYQGKRNPSHYFEGWYVKLVDGPGQQIWSLIPGISYSGDTHAFIQLIHANSGKTWYFRFPVGDFKASRHIFNSLVGPNSFSSEGLNINLSLPDIKLKGQISFEDVQPFPVTLASPGIMGWYGYVPGMECYHGVVSMQHSLSGYLDLNGKRLSFDGGKGYIEKDWGRSMPSDWIWIQSNHFEQDPGASFMLSLARIPWKGSYFPGFLSFFKVGGELYRFATYKKSIVDKIVIDKDQLQIRLKSKKHNLAIIVFRRIGGILKAPRHGEMDREIKESIVSSMEIELKDNKGQLLFRGTGAHTGLEIVGDVEKYFNNKH